MAAPKLYTRLTRNTMGVATYSSLWLGPDHVMIVRSSGYNEHYARIELRDLKGIMLTRTARRTLWGLGWAIITAWSGTIMAMTLGAGGVPIFSSAFFLLGAIGFGWNLALGPGCRAYVFTGVQAAELPPIVRLPQARRVLAKLEPMIAEAQAELAARPRA